MEEKAAVITGPFPVDLGDNKPRFLMYSIAAVKKVQKRHGTMKDLMAKEVIEVIPELAFAGLVDEDGKPSKEFKTADDLEAIIPMPLLPALHDAVISALYGVDFAKLKADAEGKRLETETAKNQPVQMAAIQAPVQ
jgi:hypothetical protein